MDADFVYELREMKRILNTNYELISDTLPTSQASNILLNNFRKNMKKYYKSLDILLQKKVNLLKMKKEDETVFLQNTMKYDFFLFDSFEISEKFNKDFSFDDALDSLIFSPFSVNFFSQSFKDLFNDYFSQKNEEDLTSICEKMENKLKENMYLCPKFLRQILTNGYSRTMLFFVEKKLNADEIFKQRIIEKMFSNPHLFNLLNYNQDFDVDQERLEELKSAMITKLNCKNIFTIDEALQVLPSELKPPEKISANTAKTTTLTFRDLLYFSKDIPDELPPKFSKLKLELQIKFLLVDEEDKKQQEYFDKLHESLLNDKDFIKRIKNSFNNIRFQIELIELKKQVQSTIINLISYTTSFQNKNYAQYIQDPSHFFNNFTNELQLAEMTNTNSSDGNDANDGWMIISQMNNDKSDPFYINTLLLYGLTMKVFLINRPELKFAEQSFKNKIESCKDLPENQYKPLLDFKENNSAVFNSIASDFAKAFETDKDPYYTMREISKAYKNVLDTLRFRFTNNKEDEKKFIISFLNLVMPKNVFSTFVYLYEYIFAPVYKQCFESSKNAHYITVKKVLIDYVLSFYSNDDDDDENDNELFRLADFCKICEKKVELVLKNDIDYLKNLAKIIALNEIEERSYNILFDNLLKNPILNNDPRKQFTFRVYEKNRDGFVTVWVCNVTNIINNDYDEVPVSDKNTLIEFLNI